MGDIVKELSLSDDCQNLLLGNPGDLTNVLQLITAYEENDLAAIGRLAAALQIEEESVADAYLAAVKWADQLTGGGS